MPNGTEHAPFRRSAGVAIIVVVVLVELALGAAWFQLSSSSAARSEADSLSIAFTDVQRQFQELEFLAVTEPRFDTETVETHLALLQRQVSIASLRLDDPATPDQLRTDIETIQSALAEIEALQVTAPTDMEAALGLAARGQQTAQAAVDRTASEARELYLEDALDAERTATIVAAVAALVLIAGALLVWAVLLRYQRTFDEAWRVAEARRAALQATNEQLAALADTRERFVSMLSHELRSPLAVIGAAGETLHHHGDELDAETRDGILQSLRRQVSRQQRMIDDLLLVAQHANSDPDPDPTVIDFQSLFALVRRDESIEGTVAHFEVEDGVAARADEHHVEQVLNNLIRNAEKYGGNTIRVAAVADGDRAVITVSDDGDGVPAEAQDTLFEPFTQAGESKDGIGLGLSITRRLIEANGGTISYRDGEDGGAVFEIRLPRAEHARL